MARKKKADIETIAVENGEELEKLFEIEDEIKSEESDDDSLSIYSKSVGDSSDLSHPETRLEQFLAKIAGLVADAPSAAYTRLERYLLAIVDMITNLSTIFAPKAKGFSIGNGVTKNFNIANGSRMLLTFVSANKAKNAIYIISATSGGSIMARDFAPNDEDGSDLTITFSQNNLSVACASTGSTAFLYAQVFNGDISEITP